VSTFLVPFLRKVFFSDFYLIAVFNVYFIDHFNCFNVEKLKKIALGVLFVVVALGVVAL